VDFQIIFREDEQAMNLSAAVNESTIRADIVVKGFGRPVLPVVVHHPKFNHAMRIVALHIGIIIQQSRKPLEVSGHSGLHAQALAGPVSTAPRIQQGDLIGRASMPPNGDATTRQG
jgi:hypothetical protein